MLHLSPFNQSLTAFIYISEVHTGTAKQEMYGLRVHRFNVFGRILASFSELLQKHESCFHFCRLAQLLPNCNTYPQHRQSRLRRLNKVLEQEFTPIKLRSLCSHREPHQACIYPFPTPTTEPISSFLLKFITAEPPTSGHNQPQTLVDANSETLWQHENAVAAEKPVMTSVQCAPKDSSLE